MLKLWKPKPIGYEKIDPIDVEFVRLITVWPGEKVCARIERARLDEIFIDQCA
jgi:hypothetical protein